MRPALGGRAALMRYYPVFIDLSGQRCLVIGSGDLAVEKAAGLRRAGADVTCVAAADYRPGVLVGARIVFDASDDPEVNRMVWEEAEAAGILVNVVDKVDRCRFIAPAVVDRDPLVIAISTSGESPYLAGALRARLERQFGAEWGPFVATVGRVRRRLRAAGVPLARQTLVYQRLLRSGLRAMLRDRRVDEAGFLEAAIESRALEGFPGRVALVGAGPGDPGLLTAAAIEQLAEADVVFHDALVPPAVLRLCGARTRLVDVGKRAGGRRIEQETTVRMLLEAAAAGLEVVRLKGGDPFVFGRGGEEMRALLEAGVEVTVVPGVSSATAAPGLAGIPLTLRGVASSAAFASPRAGREIGRLVELARSVDTLVLLMGLADLPAVAPALARVLGERRPVAIVGSASTPEQTVVRSTLGGIVAAARAAAVPSPATIVIGEVVAASAAAAAEGSSAARGRS